MEIIGYNFYGVGYFTLYIRDHNGIKRSLSGHGLRINPDLLKQIPEMSEKQYHDLPEMVRKRQVDCDY